VLSEYCVDADRATMTVYDRTIMDSRTASDTEHQHDACTVAQDRTQLLQEYYRAQEHTAATTCNYDPTYMLTHRVGSSEEEHQTCRLSVTTELDQ